MKTLLVGLDAACWEYVRPLLEAGRLPVLGSLMQANCWGVLGSSMPPWTPAAWASIVTGKNPGKHGIFDMLWRRPGGYEATPTNASLRLGTPFWKRLNERGLRVGLVNVPFTYPPAPLDGFAVCGFGTPDRADGPVTHPAELLAWIEAEHGPYEPAVAADFLQTAAPRAILEREKEHQSRQVQIAIGLARRYQVDVLVQNLMLTDHANHKMPSVEMVQEAYVHSDGDLGRLIRALQPENVLVISDHGSSRLKGDFLLYQWLRDQGYYAQLERTPRERSAALNWLLRQWFGTRLGWSGPAERFTRRAVRSALPAMPAGIQERAWAKIEQALPFARAYSRYTDRPDGRRSRLFPGSVYSGLLYLNLAGREANGVVPAGQRQELQAEVAAGLSAIQDPDTGRPLFSRIWTGAELYHGPAAESAPDLILDSYDSQWNIRSAQLTPAGYRVRERYFVAATHGRDFGWHTRDGLFVWSGRAFRPAPADYRANLLDVPATMLHLHSAPVPEDYDGRVLTELLGPGLAERPVQRQAGDNGAAPAGNGFSALEADRLAAH
ncbi:MAG: alkaline phosphatase family protein, partial [Candidatus Promineifilaceae bacterium]